jgi:branched-chain amino acid transport system permease protein
VTALRSSTLLRHLLLAVVGGLVLLLLSNQLSPFRDTQLSSIAFTAIAAAGLTILTGGSGQVSLGQGAFMAVGAYTVALLINDRQWAIGFALVAAVILTALVGAVVGVAAARLRGPYLAGATLALAVGLPGLATYKHLQSTLGAANGLSVNVPPPPLSLGETFPLERWQAWICCLCLLLVLVLLANLGRSGLGRSFRALRDDEVAAALSGIDVARTQVLAFVVSSGCAGLAGGLLAFVNTLAAPGAFPLSLSLQLLAIIVLGGLGSLAGAVYGSVLLVLLPNWSNSIADHLALSRNVSANLPLAIYGVVLIVVMLAFPGGIQSGVRRAVRAARGAAARP